MGRRAVRRRPGRARVVLTRLFVAVYPPPSALDPLRAALPPSSRLTPLEKWHLTLVFLGTVAAPSNAAPAEAAAPAAPSRGAAVEQVAAILGDLPPLGSFEVRLSGGGRFGSACWAGVDGELAALSELREGVRDALTLGGFPSDDRPFHPHLTVSYHPDAALRQALAGYSGQPWPVTEYSLVRSVDGRYERLGTWAV
ncbi:2'-5' RNA ligase family protein [Paractinoplanes lichenicola]|uniref:RNA 2',3'-cyclic phosphodiesterase n=1 Tax=Paractinoplanes lichenicola TaxID=2802976 RepID=A0ABS1W2S3_9ACTN|nr:2'-5' RNA ligase family protein [Actinoplanes lichenicola]MBL7261023.1 2'-5' RNA ligase family protein [Actinoplanes lichenicola]